MYPIFTLAGLALIVALYKFLTFLVLRMPSNQQIKALLDAVAKNDVISLKKHAASIMKARPRIFSGAARGAVAGLAFCGIACLIYQYVPATILWIWPDYEESQIASMPVVQLFLLSGLGFGVIGLVWSLLIYLLQQTFGYSPVGQTLAIGVEHIDEPRDLIEEVMYEKVLATRFRLNSMLSFISISAASAPLLGLLGTVTGIINTFKLITVFGSGDVKTLSGGISEALITTEFGLIVAIPSLLLHAFLSRKARGVIDQMEKAAISLANQISKTHRHATAAVSAEDLAITDSDKQDVSDAVDDALEDEDDYDMDSGELVEAGSNGSKKQSRPQRVPAAVMER
ncbi:MotA/TolQ/ExbB proton channel family protein [Candidatus Sumerlaeota bacterium]|nr:MotA/TolQ/ExbB proton channel family protein [Candidatus Sumerlaeota bacterium]